MPLVTVILILIVIGVLFWLFEKYITFIDPTFKLIIKIVVIVGTVLWLLKVFGVWDLVTSIKI